VANIFISHSSEDNDSASEILGSLQEVGSSIFLDFDSKHGLKGGQKWEKELYVRVKKSRIMIVALSPNWLNSTWCYKEYCMARVLRKKIIPVIIKEDERIEKWDGNDIQHYDTIVDIDAIEKLKERVKKLTHSDVAKLYDIEKLDSPFPGLRSFNKDEAGIFHGRNEDILNSVDMLNGMIDSNEKFLNIIGASGVGKSSFLKAGILPFIELLHTDLWYILPIFRAKQELLLNLAKVLASVSNRRSLEVLSMLRKSEFIELFEEIELNAFDSAKEKNEDIENIKILFPIDQAEELLSVSNKKDRDLFINILKFLLEKKSNFYLVWTLRADYLKKYQDDKSLEFVHQLETTLLLKPISSKEIKNIIQEPAFSSDILIDDAVVEEIKENISSTLSLPILAYLLQTLFRTAKSDNRKQITINDYNALSKDGKNPIENIINESANAIYDKTEDIKSIKDLFLTYLVKINIDESITKQSAKLDNIPENMHCIIEQFVDRRLFVKDRDEEALITIEIAHEALISSWEKLIEWIEVEREFLIFKSHLNLYYNEWINANEDDKALLSGMSLEKAINFKDKLKNRDETEFIDKSIIYSEEQEKKFEDLYNKAQEEVVKAKHNIGLVFVEKANKAYDEKDFRKAVGYSYGALENLNTKLDETKARIFAKNTLINSTFYKIAVSINTGCKGDISMAVSEDRGLIISGHKNANIKLWNLLDGRHIHTFLGDDVYIRNIDLVLNDTRIVSTSMNAIIQVWDIEYFKLLYTSGDSGRSYDKKVKILNDKEMMIYLSGEYIKIINFESGEIVNQCIFENYYDCPAFISDVKSIFKLHKKDRKALDFYDNRKEKKELIRISDGLISLWDRDKILINRIYSDVDSMYVSKDKKTLITSSVEKINIFDMTSAKSFIKEITVDEKIFDMTFSNMNKNLYINNKKNIEIDSNKIFDANNDRTEIKTIIHNQNRIRIRKRSSCEVMIDDFLEVSNSDDNMVLGNFFHEDIIFDYTMSDDQKILISSSLDGTIKVWCMQNYVLLQTLDCNDYIPYDLILSDNNEYIYSSTEQGYIFKWDMKKGKKILETFEGNNIKSIVLSGDKKKLVSLTDEQIKIRNIHDFKLYHEIHIGKRQCDIVVLSDNNILAFYDMNASLIEIIDLNELDELDNKLYIEHEMFLYENKSLMCIKGTELTNKPKVWEKALWSNSHPFHWLDKAKGGDSKAMYQLGLIYDRDNENYKALEWYMKAVYAGNDESKERIKFLEKWMEKNPTNPKP